MLAGISEFFYILDGRGELWRATESGDDVTELVPGRCVAMPPGTPYQYRTGAQSLSFLAITAPRWEPKRWSCAGRGRWSVHELGHGPPASAGSRGWWTTDLRQRISHTARDGSEIRNLLEVEAGGFAHCTLGHGALSSAVRHRTVDEIWLVLGGHGEVRRSSPSGKTAQDELRPGRCVTIPVGTSLRFQADGDSLSGSASGPSRMAGWRGHGPSRRPLVAAAAQAGGRRVVPKRSSPRICTIVTDDAISTPSCTMRAPQRPQSPLPTHRRRTDDADRVNTGVGPACRIDTPSQRVPSVSLRIWRRHRDHSERWQRVLRILSNDP